MKMKNRYRIVRDFYCGYEAQVKLWWFPVIWLEMGSTGGLFGVNTHSTQEQAVDFIKIWDKGQTAMEVKID